MASLHRDSRGKSPYFYCAFTLPNGKRAFRSTKQTDRKAALKMCLAWEDAAEAAGQGNMTEVQARKVLDSILASVGERKIQTATVNEFFTQWLAGKRVSTRASTVRGYSSAVGKFLDFLGPRSRSPLAALSTRDIESYRDSRSAVSPATIKRDLKTLRAILSQAHRKGLVVHNVAGEIDLPPVRSTQREVFTPEELRTILAEASPDWKTAILLGYYTGARLGDIVAMRWENVDLVRGAVVFRQGKTERMIEIPLHEDLKAYLLTVVPIAPQGLLCRELSRTPLGGGSGLSQQFGRLMERAGVGQAKVQVSRSRQFSCKSFHSLRHSFASALANAGVSPEFRMLLAGHKSTDVHQRYTHVELAPLRAGIAALPSIEPKKSSN